eukprot:CAMPEP_0171639254 /NCGR_PEP_ID=MMETSP0990-20121206/29588_1 /TAXON_ID=483369 /ORGANISM="non described non described, Strain CCMP2098" /LENGTH=50 /DNA_ID=CAMNT_0012212925 /DNA_START=179 /DNA_END=331 /DNA_ORIENTATION=+
MTNAMLGTSTTDEKHEKTGTKCAGIDRADDIKLPSSGQAEDDGAHAQNLD